LIRDLADLDSLRQFRAQARYQSLDFLPGLQDVSRLVHGDADADDFLTVEAHLEVRWIDQASAHLREVAHPEIRAVEPQCKSRDCAETVEPPGDAQRHIVSRQSDRTGRHYRVLRLQR